MGTLAVLPTIKSPTSPKQIKVPALLETNWEQEMYRSIAFDLMKQSRWCSYHQYVLVPYVQAWVYHQKIYRQVKDEPKNQVVKSPKSGYPQLHPYNSILQSTFTQLMALSKVLGFDSKQKLERKKPQQRPSPTSYRDFKVSK